VHGNEKKASRTRALRTETGEVGAVKLAMAYLGMALRAVAAHPEYLSPAAIDNDLLLGQVKGVADTGPPPGHSHLHQLALAILLCREKSRRGLLQSRLAGSGDLSSMQACVAEYSDCPV
jgi:hypothetical protein